jgi:uncharacterized repeat protein (TIGR01451 family)
MKKLCLVLLLLAAIFTINAQAPQLQWSKKITPFTYDTYGQVVYDIARVNNGGYILAGSDTLYYLDKYKFLNKEYGERPLISRTDNQGNVIWSKTSQPYYYNGFYTSVIASANGDFVAAGYGHNYIYSSNQNVDDLVVTKYKNDGTLSWSKPFGGSNLEYAQGITQTKDGNYALAGYTNSNDGSVSGNHGTNTYDFWVIKLDTAGTLLWQKCFGGSGDEKAYSIQQTTDGGYVVAGKDSSNDGNITNYKGASDGWVIKLDASGNLQWQKSIGGSRTDAFKSVLQTSDGGYLLTGYTYSNDNDVSGNHGDADVWVVKLDASGNLAWQKCFGGSSEEYASQIEGTVDNAFLISAHTLSNNGNVSGLSGGSDLWLIKIDEAGNLLWQKTIGGAKDEFGMTVTAVGENEFLVGGVEQINSGFYGDPSDIVLYDLGNYNTIKGTVFLDDNKNGIKDGNEPLYSNVTVKSTKQDDVRIALPTNGIFQLSVDSGSYQTSVIVNKPYYQALPSSYNSAFSNYFNSDSISFAIQPIGGKRDLSINLLALTPSRPGFGTQYKIVYTNQGTDTVANGTVQLIKSDKLNLLSASPTYSSISGDTLRWNYSNLKPQDTAGIIVNLSLAPPPAANNGDKLTSVATIAPAATDLTPEDNTSVLVQTVVGSYDPNDKTEVHGGILTQQQLSKGEPLVYTIRFQNTGTDTAFNVIVRDTLSNKVDWNTLRMISSSHNYQLIIKDGNKLTWAFNNINLVDSNHNERASHGYLSFSVRPTAKMALTDTIKNISSIYFDFNLPVTTNTERTSIETTALPVKLITFIAERSGADNKLTWVIADEQKETNYEVERSTNARDFLSIGKVSANNTSSYTFADNAPLKMTNYYRLKLIEKGGSYQYSPVRSVNNSSNFAAIVYPNPVHQVLSLNLNTDRKTVVQMEIVTLDGKVLQTIRDFIWAGVTIKNVNIAALSKGTYFIRVKTIDEQIALKFEKN